MNLVKVKDNNIEIETEELSSISKLAAKIVNKSLSQLRQDGLFVFPETLKDAEDLDDDQFILRSFNNCYRTSNIMGFIGYEDEQLIIESRFSNDGHDYFFEYLLSKVLDIPNIVDLETTFNKDRNIFDYLPLLFPLFLKQAIRKGLFKQYIRREYNDENVKGTIDFARHIKANVPFTGKIAYNQREFSYDNELIELIRHTIEYIRMLKYGNKILNKVNNEVKQIIDVTRTYSISDRNKIINKNIKHPIRHAYYKEYRTLQQLCLLILTHKGYSIGQGQKRIYGIIFDGSWLWEEYLNTLIKDYFYHPKNKINEGGQWLFNNNTGRIYPDFLGKDINNRIIADAKYKPESNIGNKDYLQLLAYMFRFDAKNGYYLYPEINEVNAEVFNLNKGITYEKNVSKREDIVITKLGLRIPNNKESYDDFKKEIENYEKKFIEKVNSQKQY